MSIYLQVFTFLTFDIWTIICNEIISKSPQAQNKFTLQIWQGITTGARVSCLKSVNEWCMWLPTPCYTPLHGFSSTLRMLVLCQHFYFSPTHIWIGFNFLERHKTHIYNMQYTHTLPGGLSGRLSFFVTKILQNRSDRYCLMEPRYPQGV